ncbi:DUF7822 domain-containing protein [Catenulispora pinisilvae]|uniref:DUF7822 domain-containing protein n=1 Tax=Catenulispora pinisilvae TaxID=2705253 RepID=UPI001E53D934|nr:hypothetical protein [Catenulispora pinisilvae]
MANRSHLYAANTLPSAEGRPDPVVGISEHNWSIPLAHLILVSFDTRAVPSMIWDQRMGVAGDYDRGAALLVDLLRLVGEEVEDEQDFHKVVEKTKAQLARQRAKYFLLEAGEILDMDDEPHAEALDRLVGHHIPFLAAQAEAAIAGENAEWLAIARGRWRENFNSFYDDTLYYSFE